MIPTGEWAIHSAWGMDMCRALAERPWWARLLVRLGMGRYAHRELMGLRKALEKHGHPMWIGYGLEGCDYHQERVSYIFPDARIPPL